MNEGNLSTVDTSNVAVSDPVDTSSVQRPEAPVTEAPKEEVVTPVEATDEATADAVVEPVVEAEEADPAAPDSDRLMDLLGKTKYTASDVELDIYDEYGNVDANKMGSFMAANNERVFQKAVDAVNAKNEARDIEDASWSLVHKDYPEVKDKGLDTALRGARIQDLAAGGNGDLSRLAKDLVKPFRDSQIKAIEDVNRSVKEQDALATFKPVNATPEKTTPSNMQQLQTALKAGDTERATFLRHAIRKERIYGTDNKVSN